MAPSDMMLFDMAEGAPSLLVMLKNHSDRRTRDAIGQYIAAHLNANLKFETAPTPLDEEDMQLVQSVRQTGIALARPLFSPGDIEEIEAYFADKPLYFYGPEPSDLPRRTGLLHERPSDYRFGSWEQPVISSCPSIMAAAHDSRVLALAEAYLGAPPTLRHIDLWWSFPNAGPPWGIQNFHFDVEDFRTFKIFVYLSDVDAGSGPHEFVEESHSMEALDRVAQRREFSPDKYEKFMQWSQVRRKSEGDIRKIFDTIRTVVGPKGLTFAADTRGVHRGLPPTSGNRLIFEFCFCCVPILTKKHRHPVSRSDSIRLDQRNARATRLFYC